MTRKEYSAVDVAWKVVEVLANRPSGGPLVDRVRWHERNAKVLFELGGLYPVLARDANVAARRELQQAERIGEQGQEAATGTDRAAEFARRIVQLVENRPNDSVPVEERAEWHEANADVLIDIGKMYPVLAREAFVAARRQRTRAQAIREQDRATS
ncbi:hypothetical protein [Actinocrispum wychmicini]|uniref:Uncharacterized protein n=1 Tax=Actinocrispum wychmicini TaxID=1213861 RepID=A0A4R2K699_9PSEU|nr:hypothetical protein [Actinocrispum wychmicini]TCO61865.1 hypothetical protein EV192_1022 [Actinocrispum wychmicini]